MKIIWWETLLVVCLPLFILGLYVLYRLFTIPNPIVNNTLEEILPKLNTGDLFIVRYRSVFNQFIKVVCEENWSHTGFIYKDNTNAVYIIEMAEYSEFKRKGYTKKPGYEDIKTLDGLNMVPIEQWLELNNGRIVGYLEYDKQRPENSKVMRVIKEYADRELDANIINWLAGIYGWMDYSNTKKSQSCFEFTAYLLQQLGMLDTEKQPNWYYPARIAKIPDYKNIQIVQLSL